MLDSLVTDLQSLIEQYSFFGVLAASFIEEVIAPLPSAVVMMFASFTLVTGSEGTDAWLKIFGLVALPVAIGITLGSMVFYWIAYYVGKPLMVKYGRWLGLSWHALEKAEQSFSKGYADEVMLFAVRAIPIVPNVAVNAFCGLVRLNFKKFVIFTFFGSFVRGVILGIVGWQLGEVYEQYAHYFGDLEKIVLGAGVVLVVVWFGWRQWRKRKRRHHNNNHQNNNNHDNHRPHSNNDHGRHDK